VLEALEQKEDTDPLNLKPEEAQFPDKTEPQNTDLTPEELKMS